MILPTIKIIKCLFLCVIVSKIHLKVIKKLTNIHSKILWIWPLFLLKLHPNGSLFHSNEIWTNRHFPPSLSLFRNKTWRQSSKEHQFTSIVFTGMRVERSKAAKSTTSPCYHEHLTSFFLQILLHKIKVVQKSLWSFCDESLTSKINYELKA